jgi:hypothetical protein
VIEVHPPHERVQGWRDFFVHLITITVGLLIALSLEGLVEMVHHHNLVNQAKADLKTEITQNHDRVVLNLPELRADEKRVEGDIRTLMDLRAGKKLSDFQLNYSFEWKSLGNSAWKTAESSGALSFLDFEKERDLAHVYYVQEDIVAPNLTQVLREHSLAWAPILSLEHPEKSTKEEIQLSLQRSADLLADLKSLEGLLKNLDQAYVDEMGKL